MYDDEDLPEREAAVASPITLADVGVFLVTPLVGLAQGWSYAFQFAQLCFSSHSRWKYEGAKFKRDAGEWIESLPTTTGGD